MKSTVKRDFCGDFKKAGRSTASNRRVVAAVTLALVPMIYGCDNSIVSTVYPASQTASLSGLAFGPNGGVRDWNALNDSALWNFLVQSDTIATIGLKSPGAPEGYGNGELLIDPLNWTQGQASVLAVPGVRLVKADTLIPWIRVKLRDVASIALLRVLPHVEYVEPAYITGDNIWASGCEQENYTSTDFTYASNGDILPAIYTMMRIDRAWAYANGSGVWVGLTDTGADEAQSELSIMFQSYDSPPRTIWRTNTDGSSSQTGPGDLPCTHGTRLAGVIAAPMNNSKTVGVAWGANLASVKTDNRQFDVNSTDALQGIRDAGNHGARIINMSWQTSSWFNSVADEIRYWYYQRDVVFVGAAGTYSVGCDWFNNNVVFPAEMTEVLAVSPSGRDGHRPCSSADGDELDVVAYHVQPTIGAMGRSSSDIVSVGESSHASAIVAGIAALVRQRFPSLTNRQVYDRIINTSGDACGMPWTWHRIVNAEAAAGGLCLVNGSFHGPIEVIFTNDMPETVYYSFRVDVTGGNGPLEYQWSNGYTGPGPITYGVSNLGYDYAFNITVRVRDTGSSNPAFEYVRRISVYDRTCVLEPQQLECDPEP